jgi:hypothetical protein
VNGHLVANRHAAPPSRSKETAREGKGGVWGDLCARTARDDSLFLLPHDAWLKVGSGTCQHLHEEW